MTPLSSVWQEAGNGDPSPGPINTRQQCCCKASQRSISSLSRTWEKTGGKEEEGCVDPRHR